MTKMARIGAVLLHVRGCAAFCAGAGLRYQRQRLCSTGPIISATFSTAINTQADSSGVYGDIDGSRRRLRQHHLRWERQLHYNATAADSTVSETDPSVVLYRGHLMHYGHRGKRYVFHFRQRLRFPRESRSRETRFSGWCPATASSSAAALKPHPLITIFSLLP